MTQKELAEIKNDWYQRGVNHGEERVRNKFKDLLNYLTDDDVFSDAKIRR